MYVRDENDKSIHMNKQSYTKQIADAIQRSFSEIDEDTYSYLSKKWRKVMKIFLSP